jgi:hypothetical protein
MPRAGVLFALAVMLTAAGPRTIQAPPLKTGDCHWVHGRFTVYNGASVQRIWIAGTKRIVALPDDADVPATLKTYEAAGAPDPLYADFRICALEDNRPGRMQHVHVADVRNPVLRGTPFHPKEP